MPASARIAIRVCVCPMTEKEKAGKRCRSRSSWIMQPYLYLVSDCDFWEISSLHAQTYTPTRPHVTETHTRGARFSIPSLMPSLPLFLSRSVQQPPDSRLTPKVAKTLNYNEVQRNRCWGAIIGIKIRGNLHGKFSETEIRRISIHCGEIQSL